MYCTSVRHFAEAVLPNKFLADTSLLLLLGKLIPLSWSEKNLPFSDIQSSVCVCVLTKRVLVRDLAGQNVRPRCPWICVSFLYFSYRKLQIERKGCIVQNSLFLSSGGERERESLIIANQSFNLLQAFLSHLHWSSPPTNYVHRRLRESIQFSVR